VTLTFEEAVTLPQNPISVTGPNGAAWTVGTATVHGASVSAPVQATGPAGQYLVHYAVIADDGDTVKGTVSFNLTSAAGAAATDTTSAATASAEPVAGTVAAPAQTGAAAAPTTADTSSDSGSSAWTWVAVVVVVLGLAAAGFLVARRRRADSGTR
jgi:hypothetical protein